MTTPARPARPLIALGVMALVLGAWAGLARIGVGVGVPRAEWIALHGPLMASGFFGTVICAERAVAIKKRVALAAPLLSGLGAIAAAAGAPRFAAAGASTLAALGLVVIVVRAMARGASLDLAVSAAGAASWALGNALWLAGRPVSESALAWAAFLVLTVGAERLELTRVVPRPAYAKHAFAISAALVVVAPPLALASADVGARVLGAGLFALGAWLVVWDVARRTIARPGLPRFSAACMLAASAWLVVAGALALALGVKGAAYDAVLHAVFLGFALSMVFGHAPTVLAAVAGVEIAYTPRFWAHLVLLHASVAARVAADLVSALGPARPWAGALHVVALVVFVAMTATSRARRAPAVDRPSS